MKISNIRFGFACNSSSLHSILVFNDKKPEFTDESCNGEFGSDGFIASSYSDKLDYISLLLQYSIREKVLPQYLLDYYMREWVGNSHLKPKYSYIDHQSIHSFPCYPGTNYLNKEFFDDFKRHILDDKTVIYGGSDEYSFQNGSPDVVNAIKCYNATHSPAYKALTENCEYVRKDPVYNYYTLFSKRTGAKIRLSFDDEPITCSSLPELVDVKITDYCTQNCPYCYQNSSSKGKHARYDDIKDIIDSLADLGVFEIAWNGGEPTSHPDFIKILEYANSKGIVSNFTTTNVDWFRDTANFDVFCKCCGAVAFSYGRIDLKQVEALREWYCDKLIYEKKNYIYRSKSIVLQCIDGIDDPPLDTELSLTMLGFKKAGRGKTKSSSFHRSNHVPFKDLIKNRCDSGIGVDTAYLQQYSQEIKECLSDGETNIYDYLTSPYDGLFSMYIDAVSLKIGPYSYCDESELKSICSKSKHNYLLQDDLTKEIQVFFESLSKKTARSLKRRK